MDNNSFGTLTTKRRTEMCKLESQFNDNNTYFNYSGIPFNSQQQQVHQQQQPLVDLLASIERATADMFRATGASSKKRGGATDNNASAAQHNSSDDSKRPPTTSASVLGSEGETSGHSVTGASGSGQLLAHCDQVAGSPHSGSKKRKRSSTKTKAKDPNSTEKGHKRSYVKHQYHDHSQDPETNEEEVPTPKNKGGITTPFPMQLHDMLQHADIRGFDNIVSWQPHGRAFLVHDPQRFVSEVMPMFFRQTRMSSFQRQLSLYGFLRLTRKGADHGAYYHELFLRGLPHLCRRMQRTRVKGYWVRQSSSPETEPDFSSMPIVGQPGQIDQSRMLFHGIPSAAAFPASSSDVTASVPNLNNSLSWLVGTNNNDSSNQDNDRKVGLSLSTPGVVAAFRPTEIAGFSSQQLSASILQPGGFPHLAPQPPPPPLPPPMQEATSLQAPSLYISYEQQQHAQQQHAQQQEQQQLLGAFQPQHGSMQQFGTFSQFGFPIQQWNSFTPPQSEFLPEAPLQQAFAAPAPIDQSGDSSVPFYQRHQVTSDPLVAVPAYQPQHLRYAEAPSAVAAAVSVSASSAAAEAAAAQHEQESRFLAMSSTEVNDMVAFLSDVDLSGNESSVGESFEEEAKIAMVGGAQSLSPPQHPRRSKHPDNPFQFT
ncbi:hypothetical protein ACA910_013161 [Epithemia clementina (nom. ined.)]